MSFSVEKCVAHLAILVYYGCYVQKLASIAVGKPGIIIDSALFSICTSSLIRYCGRGFKEYWYCTSQLQIVHTLYKNRAKSTGGNRARFSCSKKYNLLPKLS